MSKIVQAINVMIANKDKISDVRRGNHNIDEYFFSYKSKYVWSIAKNADETFSIYNYPLGKGYQVDEYVNYLSSLEINDFAENNVDFVGYSTKELSTREAKDSFSELYTIVKENILGIDTVLDDIINDDAPF